jgi:hypothetical protein
MKFIISVSFFLSIGVYAQSNSTTNPTGVGFGADSPGNTITPPIGVPSPGAVPGSYGTNPATATPDVTIPNEFGRQEMEAPGVPRTTPQAPDNLDTFPDRVNPTGTGVIPGPTGSSTVGP